MPSSAPDKTLVIAEKPSVAGDIARALGGMKSRSGKRGIDFYEGEKYIVSSAVGHLLEITAPEQFEVKSGKWKLDNLPVLPEYFDLSPIKTSADRLRVLEKLYRRPDIKDVINACDAGREGELIFSNLIRYFSGGNRSAKTNQAEGGKPVRRLWLSSMTPAAIRAGFGKLREGDSMHPLREAAESRDQADWLVGVNATRAMTALHSPAGSFMLTTVGRVQTPTLAILVDREQQITAFIPADYWEVRASFAAEAGVYEGLWIDPKPQKGAKPERIWEEARALKITNECKNKTGKAEEKTKPSSELPPLLFDLTSLQREANTRFGLPARATLGAAQALYERHKAITYPRTDSKALPEDYPAVVSKTLAALAENNSEFGKFAAEALQKKLVQPANKRVFNNAKVSDHFAIAPTGEPLKHSAKDIEKKIYRLIVMRFIAAFFPPAKYETTERRTAVAGHVFLTKGRILIAPGWRAVGGQAPQDAKIAPLKSSYKSPAQAGEEVSVQQIAAEKKRTAPPPRYNEATLLSAMEGAGKFVEDEELREAMRERGMGTPATRAAIIERLVAERYVARDGRELKPTGKAHALLRLLRALRVEDLTLPMMTGEWEYKLRRIERNKFNGRDFMKEIHALIGNIVSAAKACGDVEGIPGDYAVLRAKCPACGGEVRESHRRFSCQQCEFFIWKAVAGREFSVPEAEALLGAGKTEELSGFRSKMGREFSAETVLQKDDKGMWRAAFDFDKAPMPEDELRQKESVGACPKCNAPVRDAGNMFLCERKPSEACDFSLSRRLLRREMQAEEIKMLLEKRKTALLQGFVSKRTGRPFSAHLTLTEEGKLGFEFAAPKGAKAAP
ncbi:MAG: DNA topoisomerase III, partial [Gammaproteobacteria bacterium]